MNLKSTPANSMRRSGPALALTLATAAIPMPAVAVNLIANGDFESCAVGLAPAGGTLASCGWIFGDGAGVNLAIGNPDRGVRLESNGLATRDPTMAQTVGGLTVGATYRLAWDLDRRSIFPGTNGDPSFGVFLDSQDYASALFLLTLPVDGYLAYFTEFVASANSHTFLFAGELDGRSNGVAGSDTDVAYNIDNVCLDVLGGACGGIAQGVSEPAPLALLGAAMLGWNARRRRRGA